MDTKIIVYGYGDKTAVGFPTVEDLIKYLQKGIFSDNDCRHRYTQSKKADVIVVSQDGFAYGHMKIKDIVDPNPNDRNVYPKTKKVYIIESTAIYKNPVRLKELGIRVTSFGTPLSSKQFEEIKNKARKIEKYPSSSDTGFGNIEQNKKVGSNMSAQIRGRRRRGNLIYSHKIDFDKEDFCKALSKEGLLNEKEMLQLSIHYQMSSHKATPTELSKLLGDYSHQAVSSRNVRIAKKISKFIGKLPPVRKDGTYRWWALLWNAEKKGRHWECELKPEVVEAIEELKIFQLDEMKINQEELEQELYFEGAAINRKVNIYERDAKARERCLEFYKRTYGRLFCQICNFDFEKTYGAIGKDYIHIHHIVPISVIGAEYQIVPEKDLIPVCPNCHAMLHRLSEKVLTVDELKNIICRDQA